MLAACAAKADGKVCFLFIGVCWQQKTTQFKQSFKKFCESLDNFLIAVSWGGYESLVMPKCAFVDERDEQVNRIRFYIGLEETEVLLEDLENKLTNL